jgi:hypothetical protein
MYWFKLVLVLKFPIGIALAWLGVEIGIALAFFALVLHWRWYLC